jgi:hypothetical protein
MKRIGYTVSPTNCGYFVFVSIDVILYKDLLHLICYYRLSFFEAPRNPLLNKNSEGWLNCHILTPLIDDCFLTCEEVQVHRYEITFLVIFNVIVDLALNFFILSSGVKRSIERKNLSREESERKQYGHKIDILFRIDDTEYFGSETYVDEDSQNSKPISYKQKLLREMKDQLDRLLKRLHFTRETARDIKNIIIHGINQGGTVFIGRTLISIIFHTWLKPSFYIQ